MWTGGLVNSTVTAAVTAIASTTLDSRTQFSYNVRGELITEYSPLYVAAPVAGNTSVYAYNSFGDYSQILTPTETSTYPWDNRTFGYTRRGLTAYDYHLLNGAAAGSMQHTYYYDAFGRTITDHSNNTDGRSHQFRYDRADRQTTVLDQYLNQTSYSYDARSNLIGITDRNGKVTGFAYDLFNRNVTTTTAEGVVSTVKKNAYGQTIQITDGAARTTSYTYDKNGNLKTVTDAAGTTTNSYDNTDRLFETTDARGVKTRFTYDAANRVLTRVEDFGGLAITTAYAYDAKGQQTQVTEASGTAQQRITVLSYDLKGQTVSVVQDSGGLNIRTDYVYRSDGKVVSQTDAVGTAQERKTVFEYDTVGRLTRKTEDQGTGKLNVVTNYVWDVNGNLVATSDALARITRFVYDAENRQIFSVNAEGEVTETGYDKEDRAIWTRAYANRIAAATLAAFASEITAAQVTAAAASSTADYINRTLYDGDGRAAYAVDGEGYVTKNIYDGANNVIKTLRYAAGVSVDNTASKISLDALVPVGDPVDAAITQYAFDSANRLYQITDGAGSVTRLWMDALDNITQIATGYSTADESITIRNYDNLGRMTLETRGYLQPEAATTNYAYDALGRVTTITDPLTFVTTRTWDKLGRMLTEKVQVDATPANDLVTNYQYDARGNRAKATDPRGSIGYFYYDNIDRLTLQIDPEGYATETAFLIGGTVASVKRYYTKTSGATVAAKPVLTTNAADALTQFAYDKAYRLTSTTDAQGFVESYTLDAFGNRITITGKSNTAAAATAGLITTNTFDKRGLLKTESWAATTNAALTVTAPAITNTYTYDARGNLKIKVEASGRPEARTTTYSYDKLDRLINKTGDQVPVLNIATGATTNVVPSETYTYDLRGNLIKVRDDATTAATFYYYDDLDRKTAEVNAAGMLTKWDYDRSNNVTAQRAYATAVTPALGGAAPAGSGVSRQTLFTYDRNNRLTATSMTGLQVGSYNGSSYSTGVTTVTNQATYDAAGNVVVEIDGNNNSTFHYFDTLNREVAKVDQEKYLTVWVRDGEGNVTKETRYATKIASAVTQSTAVASLITAAGTNAGDRVTDFTYDKNGRRLTEIRRGVASNAVNASGALIAGSTDATISYNYNGLGQVTQKTEAVGAIIDYSYDKAGRLLTTKDASFTDYAAATVRKQTDNFYDGLNNLTSTREGTETVNAAVDHVTSFVYGAGGRLLSTTDATGFTHNFSYDSGGRVVKDGYTRLRSDQTTTLTEANFYAYDLLGRVTSQYSGAWSGTAWVNQPTNDTFYNTYGDIVARGVATGGVIGNAQEFAEFDNLGRVWRTNFGDGVTKAYVYDGNGNSTLLLQTNGTVDLKTGYADLNAIFADVSGNITQTFSVFDKRNKLIDTYQVASNNAGANPIRATLTAPIGASGVQYFNSAASVGASNISATGLAPTTVSSASNVAANQPGSAQFTTTFNTTYTNQLQTINIALSNLPNYGGGNLRVVLENDYTTSEANYTTTYHTSSVELASVAAGTQAISITDIPTLAPGQASYKGVNYTRIAVYQDAPGGVGRILIAQAEETSSGYVYTGGSLNATAAVQSVLQFQAENPNTASLMMLYRPLGSSAPYTVANVATPLLRADGSVVVGWYVFNLNAIGSGSFDIKYQALDASGAVLDSKAVSLVNNGQSIITATAATIPANPQGAYAQIIGTSLNVGAGGVFGGLNNGQFLTAVSLDLMLRPQGSGAAFELKATPTLTYSYGFKGIPPGVAVNLDPATLNLTAPAGYTGFDMQLVFRDYTGAQLGTATGTLTGTPVPTYSVSQAVEAVNGPGQATATWDGSFYTVLFSGFPTSTQSLNVFFRQLGSGAAFVPLAVNTTPRGGAYGQSGWWSARPPADGLTYEYWIEPRDGGGSLVGGKSYGTFVGGSQPGALTQYSDLPETVTFQPPSGQAVTLQQFRYYSGGAWSGWITYSAGGNWAYDANGLVPSRYGVYSYPIEYETYNNGTKVSSATGTLNLGYGTQSVSLTNSQSVTAKVVFQPLQPAATRIRLYWREGSTGAFTPAVIDKVGGVFAWDVDAAGVRPASGSKTLEYYYDAYDAGDVLLPTQNGADHAQGFLTIQSNQYNLTANSEVCWVIDTKTASQFLIHRAQAYNAFADIVSETDGRNNVTTFAYNTAGKLTLKTNPIVLVTDEAGVSVSRTTTENYYYDASGRLVGMRDGNNNLITQALLASSGFGGKPAIATAEFHFDGVTRYGVDVFGNVRTITDALNHVTTNSYDKADRLIQTDRPLRSGGTQLIDYYAYDGLGQRTRHTNNIAAFAGAVETTDYDVTGRVVSTKTFGNLTTGYSYTWYGAATNAIATTGLGNFGGWAIGTTNSAGIYSQDNKDMFGRLTWKQDSGGHTSAFTYDKSGRLTQQTGSTGANIAFTYYNNGYIKSITDNALKMRSTFEYDNDGNRTLETYITTDASPRFYQNAAISYDAQNRITRFLDAKADITYKYDAHGNRRNVKSIYSDGLSGSLQTQDYWYKYDQANRFVLTMGALSGSTIVTGSMGVAIGYNAAGDRATATYGSDGHSELYTYTEDGYLNTTTITGGSTPGSSTRTNDALGRVTQYTETANAVAVLSRTSTFDLDNRVVSDTTDTISGSTTTRNVQTYDYKLWNGATYTGIDQGAVTHVRNVQTVNGSGAITTNTDYTYQWWDDAKQSQIRINATNPANPNTGSWAPGFSDLAYDVNGHISKLTDTAGNRTLTYQSDAYGQVLVREEKIGATLGPRQLYYYFDGKRIGDVGNNGISTTQFDYAQVLAQRGQTQSASKNGFRGGTPVSSADFDQNYQPINDTYPGTASSIYTVRSGDTLRSIAQSAWGDANLWYLIADANGLTSATALTAGQRLVIPNKVTNFHNTSETFKPYNPGEAIGDTMPTLPEQPAPPPPPKKKGCGAFGAILLIIVAVVVTAIVAPQLIGQAAQAAIAATATAPAVAATAATGLTAALGATGAAVVGGALAAAAGSIVSQVVGLAIGIQDKFSWKGVAVAAISGAVGGGLGRVSLLGKGAGALANDVARGAVSNALTQGVSIATGLQRKFDWTAVAVGGAVAGGAGVANRTLANWGIGTSNYATEANIAALRDAGIGANHIGNHVNALVSGMAGAIAGASARSLATGSDFGDNLIAALPDVLAQTIGSLIVNGVSRTRKPSNIASAADASTPSYVDITPPLAPPNGFELPPGVTLSEHLESLGYTPMAIRNHFNAVTGALDDPSSTLVPFDTYLKSKPLFQPANASGAEIPWYLDLNGNGKNDWDWNNDGRGSVSETVSAAGDTIVVIGSRLVQSVRGLFGPSPTVQPDTNRITGAITSVPRDDRPTLRELVDSNYSVAHLNPPGEPGARGAAIGLFALDVTARRQDGETWGSALSNAAVPAVQNGLQRRAQRALGNAGAGGTASIGPRPGASRPPVAPAAPRPVGPSASPPRATAASPSTVRLPQDVRVTGQRPAARPLTRPIGQSATQNARLQSDILRLRAEGATDFRVNQHQVNVSGVRVGINRPDLQYTDRNGRRVYVEYDTKGSTRGPAHEARILANDPNAKVILIEQD